MITKRQILSRERATGLRQTRMRRAYNEMLHGGAKRKKSSSSKRKLNPYFERMLEAKANKEPYFMYKGKRYVRVETENNRMGGSKYVSEENLNQLGGGGRKKRRKRRKTSAAKRPLNRFMKARQAALAQGLDQFEYTNNEGQRKTYVKIKLVGKRGWTGAYTYKEQ